MTSSPERRGLLVIGAGPAGLAAAIAARRFGLDVLVLEAQWFPRHHVGESLVKLWPLLEELGVADEADATFQHKYGSGRVWGNSPDPHWTSFSTIDDQRGYSLQVVRSEFDQMLLRRAQEVGAEVRLGCRVVGALFDGARVVGVRYRQPDGSARQASAFLTVDATGRSGFLARTQAMRQHLTQYPTLSVYGYARGARRFAGERAGNLFIEAVPAGWIWFIPLHDDTVSVGLVTDKTSQELLHRLGPHGTLCDAIRVTRTLGPLLAEARFPEPVRVTASGGYVAAHYAGPGWLTAGDAGAFTDPMWATGVANALRDGMRCAAVAEAIQNSRVNESDALSYHQRLTREQSERLDNVVRFVYAANHLFAEEPFWRHRRTGTRLHSDATNSVLSDLIPDPSARYFSAVFEGMGIAQDAVQALNQELDHLDSRNAKAAPLAASRWKSWTPTWSPGWPSRPAVGSDEFGRLQHGIAYGSGETEQFTADTATIRALSLVDGHWSAPEIVDAVVRDLPSTERALTHWRVLASLRHAYALGMLGEQATADEQRSP